MLTTAETAEARLGMPDDNRIAVCVCSLFINPGVFRNARRSWGALPLEFDAGAVRIGKVDSSRPRSFFILPASLEPARAQPVRKHTSRILEKLGVEARTGRSHSAVRRSARTRRSQISAASTSRQRNDLIGDTSHVTQSRAAFEFRKCLSRRSFNRSSN
jgi:hypothetical protein